MIVAGARAGLDRGHVDRDGDGGLRHVVGDVNAPVDAGEAAPDPSETEVATDERDRRLVVIAADPHPYAFLADATLGVRAVDDVDMHEPDGLPDEGALVLGRVDDDTEVLTVLDPAALVARMLATGGGDAA